ncbi:MAG: MazG nucleotide pyrophosphohydrolase domain-containing protein [Promethearchaeota archaeon]
MKISEIQELMKTLYYHQDSKRGIEKTFIWLVEEIGELANLLKADSDSYDFFSISEEIADVIAWTCSLANLLEIDLEKALKTKYPMKCSKCGGVPCECSEGIRKKI